MVNPPGPWATSPFRVHLRNDSVDILRCNNTPVRETALRELTVARVALGHRGVGLIGRHGDSGGRQLLMVGLIRYSVYWLNPHGIERSGKPSHFVLCNLCTLRVLDFSTPSALPILCM